MTDASWANAWINGYHAARDEKPMDVPPHFTAATRPAWLDGWRAGDQDRQLKELGYE